MTIDTFFIDARSVLTVVSLVTFLAIVRFAYSEGRKAAFDEAANLPFADEPAELDIAGMEKHHG